MTAEPRDARPRPYPPPLPEATDVKLLLRPSPRHARRWGYDTFAKPLIDRVAATVLLVVLLPVIVVLAASVYLCLGRPILLAQRRVGRDGTVFGMYKFRTMEPDRRRSGAPVPPETDRRRRHKSPDDPRHTPLGRKLRAWSLDELPQLWNVVRGEMSLVGPRPELEAVVRCYTPWQHRRHAVKPGITGLWQVTERGRSGGDMHLHTAIDLDYIRTLSLRRDVSILLKTVPTLLRDEGRGS